MSRDILDLRVEVRPHARKVLSIANTVGAPYKITFKLVATYRTPAEQYQLWLKGRRGIRGESIVTYVQFGWHNMQVAFDVGPFDDQGNYVDGKHPLSSSANHCYEETGKQVTANPFLRDVVWGGDFPKYYDTTFRDLPHYEVHPGFDMISGLTRAYPYRDHPSSLPIHLTVTLPSMPEDLPPFPSPAVSTIVQVPLDKITRLQELSRLIHDDRVMILTAEEQMNTHRAEEVAIINSLHL